MSLENPSAAFLAGQAHGAALATKPKPPAKAAPHGGPRGKAKAKAGGAASVTDPSNTGALLTPQQLLNQARLLAQADTAAQVKAILAAQQTERTRAAEQAKQILEASRAAAGMLSNVGDQTAASFEGAAKDIAGFAGGYSGQLRDTAKAEAQKVLDQLASVGASNLAPGVQAQGDALANVSYGLGGDLPASALLTGGTALAAAQRQLPASTLAYGGQQSLGAIAAGDQRARELDPKLLDARAGLPAAVRQYVSTLSGLQNDEFDRKLDISKYLTGIDKFNTTTALSRARLELSAKQFAESVLQSDRSYGIALANLGISQAREQRLALAQDFKAKNGGFTNVQMNKFKTDANFVASQAKTAKTPPTGAQAMQEMYKRHVPLSLAIKTLKATGLYTEADFAGTGPLVDNGTASFDFGAGVSSLTSPFAGKTGKVAVAPGADRAGVSLSPTVKNFVATIAGVFGQPLTITTGTNHNQFVKDSDRVSDHWSGNAADILYGSGAPGKPDVRLTQLGQAALVAAGADPAWARKQTGGAYTLKVGGRRVQIIFNSLVGGNHFNHLHVGLK